MEKQITINSEYNSLAKVLEFLKKESSFECSEDYDSWDIRTDANGQMEKCVLVKKSAMHGMKVYFSQDNVLNVSYLIPNKLMNAYFGESKQRYQNILEIMAGTVKKLLLSSSQKAAFEEMSLTLNKIAA